MSKFDFTIKEETAEQFEKTLQIIKNDIKMEFLNMAKNKRKGFFISIIIALEWLGIEYKNDKRFRDNFKRKFLDSNTYCIREAESETDYKSDFIFRNNEDGDIRIQLTWFSDRGFKKLCQCMDKSPKANLVRDYFVDIEQEYVEALEMKLENFEKYRTKVLTEMQEYREKNGKIEEHSAKQSRMIVEQNVKLNRQNINLQRATTDQGMWLDFKSTVLAIEEQHDACIPVATRLGLRAYQETFGKPVVVFLVSDVVMNAAIIKDLVKKPQKSKIGVVRTSKEQIKLAYNMDSDDDVKDVKNVKDELTINKSPAFTEERELNFNTFKMKYDLANYRVSLDIEFESITPYWSKEYIVDLDRGTSYYVEPELYISLGKLSTKSTPKASHKVWDTIYFLNDAHYKEFERLMAEWQIGHLIPELKSRTLRTIYKVSYTILLNLHQELLGQSSMAVIKKNIALTRKPVKLEGQHFQPIEADVDYDNTNTRNNMAVYATSA